MSRPIRIEFPDALYHVTARGDSFYEPGSKVGMDMRTYAVVALLLVVAACSGSDVKDDFPGLIDRVTEYYRNEQNQEWAKTYELRSPGFRKSVPLATYVEQMRRDSAGWKLEAFSVIDVKKKDGKAQVSMQFVELAPTSFARNTSAKEVKHPLKMSLTEPSVWLLVDGKWYCYDAASRMHLSANNPVVPE